MSNNFTFTLTDTEIFEMVRNILNYPHARICIHNIACDFLSLLEEKGYKPDGLLNEQFDRLCHTIVNAKDEESLEIIDEILKNSD